ncbi:MAG: glycosyltransferase family 39 protein [SAR324 cluster bacterium]|nr:glycosyltransferase family 39 protein [SAR324 cluster bacterium]
MLKNHINTIKTIKNPFATKFEILALLFLIFHFALWTSLSTLFDIHSDMADHFMSSRYWSLSYYEHPPMVAWSMAWINLFPNSYHIPLLKIGSVIFNCLLLWQVFRISMLIMPKRYSLYSMLILASTAYLSLGSLFWSIDHPYLLFWLLATRFTLLYINTKNSNYLLLMGASLGFGALSKYITVLFYLSLFIWGIITHKRYKLLKNYYFYAAGIISFIIFLPVLYWNYQNDFMSFWFHLQRVLTGVSGISNLLIFTLGHILLFSPLFVFLGWIKYGKALFGTSLNSADQFLGLSAVVVLVFFSLASLTGSIVEPKYLNVSYLFLYILLAKLLTNKFLIKYRYYLRSSIVVTYLANIGLAVFVYGQATGSHLPLPSALQTKMEGLLFWKDTSAGINNLLEMKDITPPPFVISRDYQLSGILSLYLKNKPFSHTIEKEKRNLWSKPQDISEKGALVVCLQDECNKTIKDVQKRLPSNSINKLGMVKVTFPSKHNRELIIYYLMPLNLPCVGCELSKN